MSLWTVIGRAGGFIIPIVLAHLYGADPAIGLFYFAFGVITYLGAILETFRQTIPPFLARHMAEPTELPAYAKSLFTSSALASIAGLTGAGFLLGSGIEASTLYDTGEMSGLTTLFWIGSPIVILGGWNQILAVGLELRQRYAASALSGTIRFAVALSAIFVLKDRWPGSGAMIGFAAGETALFVFLVFLGWSHGIRFGLGRIKLKYLAGLGRVTGFYLVSSLIAFANPLISRVVASQSGASQVALLEYGMLIYFVAVVIATSAYGTVVLSEWSIDAARGAKTARSWPLAASTVPISSAVVFIFFLIHRPVILVIFPEASFSPSELEMLNQMAVIFAATLVPELLYVTFSRNLLLRGKTHAIVVISFFQCLVNSFSAPVLADRFGLPGIAAATVLHVSTAAVLAYIAVRLLTRRDQSRIA